MMNDLGYVAFDLYAGTSVVESYSSSMLNVNDCMDIHECANNCITSGMCSLFIIINYLPECILLVAQIWVDYEYE